MTVTPVSSRPDLERYANFAHEVYRGNSYWIPEDRQQLLSEIGGETPQASHCRIQPFIAEDDDGRVVATVTAVVDDAFNAHWKQKAGHLFYFEALPEAEDAAIEIMKAASGWLAESGCEFARLSFLFGWQLPLAIDAYDRRPTFFHTYNRDYYHCFVKNAGFFSEKGLVEYRVTFTDELAERYRGFVDGARGVSLRSWDFDRMEEETASYLRLYNSTFATHWGAPQFLVEEISGLTLGMKDYLVADFNVFAEAGGEKIGVVFAMPDLNQAQAGEAQAHGILLCIGVDKRFRGKGVNLAMAARCYLSMIEHGYKSASYTMVLDDNWPSRRTAEKLGARVARNFAVYRKDLR